MTCSECGGVPPDGVEAFTDWWHVTEMGDGSGRFCLCKSCWQRLTVEERIPHYLALYRSDEVDVKLVRKNLHNDPPVPSYNAEGALVAALIREAKECRER